MALAWLLPEGVFGQTVYLHTRHTAIYDFLDELASEQVIFLNSAVKPYSRRFIALKLQLAWERRDELTPRQAGEVAFYLEDFNKALKYGSDYDRRLDLFHYRDSLFNLTVNPIFGYRYFNGTNGTARHSWNGGELYGTIGEHWGLWASLRDNHEPELLTRPDFLNRRFGATNIKERTDYSEMQGGLTYSWKWGVVGLLKGNPQWGTGYNGTNIHSGRTPSFAQIKLQIRPADWFEFNYFHGWLVSMVVDSTRSYWYTGNYGTEFRTVYHKKFIAANMFTFTPWKRLNISAGNSIIYSDLDVHPAYLIPFLFYKSVDHTLNSGIDNQNSQLFLDVHSRQIRHLNLYATLFLDEISVSRIFDPDEQSNWISIKAGARVSNLVPDMMFTAEYTRTNPFVYEHFRPMLTYESNRYNMGHYLRDNAWEVFVGADWKPLRNLHVSLSCLYAQKGPDYNSTGIRDRGLPFLESVEWENRTFRIGARYQIIHDGFVFADFRRSNITGDAVELYTPALFQGKTGTVSLGLNFGF